MSWRSFPGFTEEMHQFSLPEIYPFSNKLVAVSEIIHFAGHSIDVQGKPVLLLRASPNEDISGLSDNRRLQNAARLARQPFGMQHGDGPISEGESPWGLIPAFLNAGAPAIIASLMPVDDDRPNI